MIWEILDFQGRSMSWLARAIGVDKSLVSRLRSGERNWTDEMKERAASALGVPVVLAFPNSHKEQIDETE